MRDPCFQLIFYLFMSLTIMSQSRKRKTEFGKEIEDYYISKRNAFDVTYEEDLKLTLASSKEIFYNNNRGQRDHEQQVDRLEGKIQWKNVYRNWNDEQFKEKFRINKETFEYILNIIRPFIGKTPTNLVSNLIETAQQLAIVPWT